MKKLYPKSVGNILKNKKLFTYSVTEHALILQQLNGILQKILPEPLAQHCQVANIRSKTLVLAASSPSWSSRLRFQTPGILKALQQNYDLPVQNIRILVSQHLSNHLSSHLPSNDVEPDIGHISPLQKQSQTFLPETHPSGRLPSKTLLSKKNADIVRATANSIESPDLRNSLIRLSRHSRKGPNNST